MVEAVPAPDHSEWLLLSKRTAHNFSVQLRGGSASLQTTVSTGVGVILAHGLGKTRPA